MRLALHQPDQPGNVGTIIRLAACLAVPLDIILPCGFALSDRALKRSGMDYVDASDVTLHPDWTSFERSLTGRLVLLTTSASTSLPAARFEQHDTLILGSESRGAPVHLHERAELHVRIPQAPATRSLNIAIAAGIGLAEALRQTETWPE